MLVRILVGCALVAGGAGESDGHGAAAVVVLASFMLALLLFFSL